MYILLTFLCARFNENSSHVLEHKLEQKDEYEMEQISNKLK